LQDMIQKHDWKHILKVTFLSYINTIAFQD